MYAVVVATKIALQNPLTAPYKKKGGY